ncbi:autophagy- protein 2 [Pelomyxa schiedti]|nr:autophagy- protein 2 [Pelomyxa schiedti]
MLPRRFASFLIGDVLGSFCSCGGLDATTLGSSISSGTVLLKDITLDAAAINAQFVGRLPVYLKEGKIDAITIKLPESDTIPYVLNVVGLSMAIVVRDTNNYHSSPFKSSTEEEHKINFLLQHVLMKLDVTFRDTLIKVEHTIDGVEPPSKMRMVALALTIPYMHYNTAASVYYDCEGDEDIDQSNLAKEITISSAENTESRDIPQCCEEQDIEFCVVDLKLAYSQIVVALYNTEKPSTEICATLSNFSALYKRTKSKRSFKFQSCLRIAKNIYEDGALLSTIPCLRVTSSETSLMDSPFSIKIKLRLSETGPSATIKCDFPDIQVFWDATSSHAASLLQPILFLWEGICTASHGTSMSQSFLSMRGDFHSRILEYISLAKPVNQVRHNTDITVKARTITASIHFFEHSELIVEACGLFMKRSTLGKYTFNFETLRAFIKENAAAPQRVLEITMPQTNTSQEPPIQLIVQEESPEQTLPPNQHSVPETPTVPLNSDSINIGSTLLQSLKAPKDSPFSTQPTLVIDSETYSATPWPSPLMSKNERSFFMGAAQEASMYLLQIDVPNLSLDLTPKIYEQLLSFIQSYCQDYSKQTKPNVNAFSITFKCATGYINLKHPESDHMHLWEEVRFVELTHIHIFNFHGRMVDYFVNSVQSLTVLCHAPKVSPIAVLYKTKFNDSEDAQATPSVLSSGKYLREGAQVHDHASHSQAISIHVDGLTIDLCPDSCGSWLENLLAFSFTNISPSRGIPFYISSNDIALKFGFLLPKCAIILTGQTKIFLPVASRPTFDIRAHMWKFFVTKSVTDVFQPSQNFSTHLKEMNFAEVGNLDFALKLKPPFGSSPLKVKFSEIHADLEFCIDSLSVLIEFIIYSKQYLNANFLQYLCSLGKSRSPVTTFSIPPPLQSGVMPELRKIEASSSTQSHKQDAHTNEEFEDDISIPLDDTHEGIQVPSSNPHLPLPTHLKQAQQTLLQQQMQQFSFKKGLSGLHSTATGTSPPHSPFRSITTDTNTPHDISFTTPPSFGSHTSPFHQQPPQQTPFLQQPQFPQQPHFLQQPPFPQQQVPYNNPQHQPTSPFSFPQITPLPPFPQNPQALQLQHSQPFFNPQPSTQPQKSPFFPSNTALPAPFPPFPTSVQSPLPSFSPNPQLPAVPLLNQYSFTQATPLISPSTNNAPGIIPLCDPKFLQTSLHNQSELPTKLVDSVHTPPTRSTHSYVSSSEPAIHFHNPSHPFFVNRVDDYISEKPECQTILSLPSGCQNPGHIVVIAQLNISMRICCDLDWPDPSSSDTSKKPAPTASPYYPWAENPIVTAHSSSKRKKSECIFLRLSGMTVRYYIIPLGAFSSYFALTLQNLELQDHLMCSELNRIFEFDRDKPWHTALHGMEFSVLSRTPAEGITQDRVLVKFGVRPFKLHIDQDTALWLFGNWAYVLNETKLPCYDIVFDQVDIAPIKFALDYVAKRLDLKNLVNSSQEIWNLFTISGAQISLPRLLLEGNQMECNSWGSLLVVVVNKLFANKLTLYAQVTTTGVRPLRTFMNLGSGMANVFLLPIDQYRKDRSLLLGINRGVVGLASIVGKEALDFFSCVSGNVRDGVSWTNDWLSGKSSAPSGKKPAAPQGTQDGLRLACNSLSREFQVVAETAYSTPMEEYHKSGGTGFLFALLKALPVVVFSPIAAATETIDNVVQGVGTTLDPKSAADKQNFKS